MKKIYTLCGVYLLALFAVVLFNPQKQHGKKMNGKNDEGADNPMALEQYMHMRYADLKTGKVPFGGAYKVYQQLVAEGLMKPRTGEARTSGSPKTWQLVNDLFPSLSITMMTYDPQHPTTYYFCTGEGWGTADQAVGAGIFKSTDAGATWNQLPATDTTTFDYCQDIKVNPVTGDIYVTTLNGLRRSTDGGNTWHEVLGKYPYGALCDAMCNIAFTKNGGVFCTGAVFQLGGVYYSDSGDSGTWTRQINGFPPIGIYRVQIATAPSNDSIAYAVACSNVNSDFDGGVGFPIQGVYKTIDKGKTWTALPNPGNNVYYLARVQAWYDLALAVNPHNPNIVVAGGNELWRTTDGGSTWQQLADNQPDSTAGRYAHVDQHEVVFVSDDTVLFGNDGGIWECDNFTTANPVIFSRNYGYRVTQFYVADINPYAGSNFIFGGTQDNGSPAMANPGISTYYDLSWADGAYCAIDYADTNIIYTTKNSNGIYRNHHNNSPLTRDTITNPYLTDNSVLFINPMVLDPNNHELLYMGSNDGLWRLTNASTAKDSDWVQACKSNGVDISAIGVSKSKANTVYLGYTNGTIYRIDGADTTSKNYSTFNCDPNKDLPGGYLANVFVDPTNVNHVFAVFTNYGIKHVWVTHNGTAAKPTWASIDGNLPNIPVNDLFMNPGDTNVCYLATNFGIFYTTQVDSDSTKWAISNQGFPNVCAEMFKYRASDNTIIAATHGRGIFQSTVNITNTGSYALSWTERGPFNVGGRTRTIMVDPNVSNHHKIWVGSIAGGLWYINDIDSLTGVNSPVVQQNNFKSYPNPFSSSVHFVINGGDKSNDNVLRIFDVSGKLVQQINCPNQMQVDWQPAAGVSPGLYFAQLTSGTNQYVQKIVYLK